MYNKSHRFPFETIYETWFKGKKGHFKEEHCIIILLEFNLFEIPCIEELWI